MTFTSAFPRDDGEPESVDDDFAEGSKLIKDLLDSLDDWQLDVLSRIMSTLTAFGPNYVNQFVGQYQGMITVMRWNRGKFGSPKLGKVKPPAPEIGDEQPRVGPYL